MRDIQNLISRLHPIQSSITSVAMGMLVEEESWPGMVRVSDLFPKIKFYNGELYNTVTLEGYAGFIEPAFPACDDLGVRFDFSRKEVLTASGLS